MLVVDKCQETNYVHLVFFRQYYSSFLSLLLLVDWSSGRGADKEAYNSLDLLAIKYNPASRNLVNRSCKLSLIVNSEYSVVSYSCRRFCLCSVKQLGKKSGKKRWIAPNTRTWPTGERGIIRIMMTGMNVIMSLKVRLWRKSQSKHVNVFLVNSNLSTTYRRVRTSRGFNV